MKSPEILRGISSEYLPEIPPQKFLKNPLGITHEITPGIPSEGRQGILLETPS